MSPTAKPCVVVDVVAPGVPVPEFDLDIEATVLAVVDLAQVEAVVGLAVVAPFVFFCRELAEGCTHSTSVIERKQYINTLRNKRVCGRKCRCAGLSRESDV